MAGPTVNGTSVLKPAFTEGLTKRAEEKLTTIGATKVLGNKALNAAPKVAGKALGLAGLMLNSAPPLYEPTPADTRRNWMKKEIKRNLLNQGLSEKEADFIAAQKAEYAYPSPNSPKYGAIKKTKSVPDVFKPIFTPENEAAYRKALEEKIKGLGLKTLPEAKKSPELKTSPEAKTSPKGAETVEKPNTSPELKMSPEAEVVDTPPMEVTDTPPMEVTDTPAGTVGDKPGVKFDFSPIPEGFSKNQNPFESSKNGLGVKVNFQPTPKTGGKPPAGKDPETEYKNRMDDTDTEPMEIEPKKEGKKASKPMAKTPTGDQWKQDRQPDYHNIINYYRTGGYGDPNSREAKSAMGSAILSEIGKMFSGISNATPVNKGGTYNVSQFDKEREAAMGQDFSFRAKNKDQAQAFERMDKELATNKDLQNYINELRKNFEKWAIQNKIDFGSDEKAMEALKKFMAAGGNQLENDWTNRILGGVVDVASSVGMAWLGNKLFKGGLKGARMFF